MKKVYEPVTQILEDFSKDITKTITETSIENNKSLSNVNNKLLEIMNDRGILASYLLSPLSKITNVEKTSQFKLVKDPQSSRFNDLLIEKTKPGTIYNILLILTKIWNYKEIFWKWWLIETITLTMLDFLTKN